MKPDETREKNEKIARFMGYIDGCGEWEGYLVHPDDPEGIGAIRLSGGGGKYNESWDWLMPVVIRCETMVSEKINSLPDERDCDIDNPSCWRAWDYRRVRLSSNIEDTYKQIVDLIDWFNEQKKV